MVLDKLIITHDRNTCRTKNTCLEISVNEICMKLKSVVIDFLESSLVIPFIKCALVDIN